MQTTITSPKAASSNIIENKTNKLYDLTSTTETAMNKQLQDSFTKSNNIGITSIGFESLIPTVQEFISQNDKDKNSTINKQEFIAGTSSLVLGGRLKSAKLLEKIFANLDKNRDGELSIDELADMQEIANKVEVRNLSDLAETIVSERDKDDDGKLSPDEFNACLARYYTKIDDPSKLQNSDFMKKLSDNIFKKFDEDGDGKLNANELEKLFNFMVQNMDVEGRGAFTPLEPQADKSKKNS